METKRIPITQRVLIASIMLLTILFITIVLNWNSTATHDNKTQLVLSSLIGKTIPQDQIPNNTHFIQILTVRIDDGSITFELKNKSPDKLITALTLKTKTPLGEAAFQRDFIYGYDKFAPGASHILTIPLDGEIKQARIDDITLLVAILDDGTIDGDLAGGREILETRQGHKHAINLFLPVLKKSKENLLTNAIDSKDVFEKLKTYADNISTGSHTGFPGAMGIGFTDRKEMILTDINEYKGITTDDTQSFLNHLVHKYSRLLKIL